MGRDRSMVVRTGRRQHRAWALLVAFGLASGACTILPKGEADLDVGVTQRGLASWYGEDFHGLLTANGEIYDMEALTGAHRTLPLGSEVLVINVENGKQVRVRINDRGPYVKGRILDLSYAAAQKLDMVQHGLSAISLQVVGQERDSVLAGHGWMLSALSSLAPVGRCRVGASGVSEVAGQARVFEQPRQAGAVWLLPGDVMRERRTRRVVDILAADQRVYAVAALQIA